MKQRLISAIIALPVLIIPLLIGGNVLTILAFFISGIGLYEFYKAFGIKDLKLYGIGIVFTILYYVLIFFDRMDLFIALLGLFVIVSMATFVIFYSKSDFKNIMIVFVGFIYVPYLISHVILVRNEPTYGNILVWLIFLTAFGSDTFAYFIGKRFGKHKLAKQLSPNKTVEGSIGGLFGAIIFNLIYLVVLFQLHRLIDYRLIVPFIIIGILGSIFAQLGDLAASGIKRYAQIKDFGYIMPGHGGVLDRLDSVMFTAPLVYYIMLLIIH